MACRLEFIEFVCQQIAPAGDVRYCKMFGDYMIYVNEKPVILVCDDIAYVKIHPDIEELMQEAERGYPYDGAKEHYVLDVSQASHATKVAAILERVLPYPKSKTKKK